MEKINKKIKNIQAALETLDESIKKMDIAVYEKDDWVLTARDSMIQRFEYCTDMLWKMLKVYLEDVEKVNLTTYGPKSIIRETVQARILSEDEGNKCVDMINKRNESSHIYLQEVAESVAEVIPGYYLLMHKIVDRIASKVKGK